MKILLSGKLLLFLTLVSASYSNVLPPPCLEIFRKFIQIWESGCPVIVIVSLAALFPSWSPDNEEYVENLFGFVGEILGISGFIGNFVWIS